MNSSRTDVYAALISSTLALATLAIGLIWQSQLGPVLIVDEASHYRQVRMFQNGDLTLYREHGDRFPTNAMLPGYHLLLATISVIFHLQTLAAIRLASASLVLGFVCAAYLNARSYLSWQRAAVRTSQALLLPILFPFIFLIYTDLLSAWLCLAALALTKMQKRSIAGFIGTLAVVTRQTNAVFLPFLFIQPAIDRIDRLSPKTFFAYCSRWWPVLQGTVILVVLIASLGRVGLDNPIKHPWITTTTNLKLSLLECGAFFLPWHVWSLRRGLTQLSAMPSKRVLFSAFALLAFSIGLVCFPAPLHPWNDSDSYPYFLRNHWLDYISHGSTSFFVTSAAITAVICSCGFELQRNPVIGWIYVYWVLTLLPFWNVDPRYHILPLTLFLLYRTYAGTFIETVLTSIFTILSLSLFAAIWKLQMIV